MDSITGFLKFAIYGLLAVGFYLGVSASSGVSDFTQNGVQVAKMPNGYEEQRYGDVNRYERMEATIQQLLFDKEALQAEIVRLKGNVRTAEARANGLIVDVRKINGLLDEANFELVETKQVFADSLLVLREVRADFAIVSTDYAMLVEDNTKTQRLLLTAERTIQQQQKFIQQQKSDLATAKRDAKRCLVLLIVLMSLILLSAVLYWLNATGKIDLSRFKSEDKSKLD